MHKLVLASHNKKKIRELAAMLEPLGITLIGMDAFPDAEPPEETGKTFVENVLLKARYAAQVSGLPSLADDSGLSVDSLGGEPGVYSARFAGPDAQDSDNNAELLRRMSGLAPEERKAGFVCVLALVLPGAPGSDKERTWRGESRGVILQEPRGENGFGYDPLFLSDDLGVTFAEANDGDKNQVSHRGRAIQAMLNDLKNG